MKKDQKASKTLSLSKDTLRMLNDRDFSKVAGGMDGSGQTGCHAFNSATCCRQF